MGNAPQGVPHISGTNWQLCTQNDTNDGTGIVTNYVAKHADQHGRANQHGPSLGDGHTGSGSGAADIGVGCDNRVLQVELENLGRAEAEEHVDQNQDKGQPR